MKRERAAEQKGRKTGLDEGRKLGLDEGRKKGLDEGLNLGRNLLLGIIEMRIGHVSLAIRQRIDAADAPDVHVWGQKVLAGVPLEEVFGIS